jgi:hypothetical protein
MQSAKFLILFREKCELKFITFKDVESLDKFMFDFLWESQLNEDNEVMMIIVNGFVTRYNIGRVKNDK